MFRFSMNYRIKKVRYLLPQQHIFLGRWLQVSYKTALRDQNMENEQKREWARAQNIEVSVDLIKAAKKQLNFLAVIDRNRHLYENPALKWAIYRYNAFWLPLLAKHLENPVSEGPLVVPLDCEWIWHCHRLNPVIYKLDCEKLFGRILGNRNVVSYAQGTSSESRTEEVWNQMHPEEPYELDYSRPFPGEALQKNSHNAKFTNYDLVSAVKRQVPFSFQVSRPHMSDDLFLQEAVARYKGFLHLIRTNRKKGINQFCVPTYDVDFIWHSHQLNPVSYCKDLCELLGEVLEHDDTVSDRTKGKKLDTGFSATTKQWEKTFGLRYWKAGAMYRGTVPNPVTQIPFPFSYEGNKLHAPNNWDNNLIEFPKMKSVEILLELVEIKNLPEGHKGDLRVSFSKKQTDKLFNVKRRLNISSESGEKQIASFQCEPTGEFLFEIECHLPSSTKPFGSCFMSLQECLASATQLSIDKWIPVVPVPGISSTEPILLHVSLSFTPPTLASQVFHLVKSPKIGKVKHAKDWTRVIDDDGNDILSLNIRGLSEDMRRSSPDLLKEVHCIMDSGETHTLAEFRGNEWFIKGSNGFFKLIRSSEIDGQIFDLVGHKMVKMFAGRRLDYEPKHNEKQRSELDFMTAIEFSRDYPYGRAAALIDFKHGILKVKDEWMIVSGITLAFILSDMLGRWGGFTAKVGHEERIRYLLSEKKGISHGGNFGGTCGGCECSGCGVMSADCGGGGGGTGGGSECTGCEVMSADCGGTGCAGCGGGCSGGCGA